VGRAKSDRLACVILAADTNADFNSLRPKVLHEVARVPMVVRTAAVARPLCDRITIVVGQEAGFDELRDRFGENVEWSVQNPPLDTGHALAQCEGSLDGFDGDLLVLRADCPLLREATVSRLVNEHQTSGAALTVLAAGADDPVGSGNGCADARQLFDAVHAALAAGSGQECGLADVAHALKDRGAEVATVVVEDADELRAVGSRVELAEAERICWQRRRDELMAAGVTLHDPETVYVADTVQVGRDTELWPNTYLLGNTVVGTMCTIGPESRLEDCEVDDGAAIEYSHCLGARVGSNARVGPFSRLRPGTVVGPGDRIGNFVEIKNSQIGAETNVSHLSYVGDATVGDNVNIGAGTITANYDGVRKHRTTIEDDASIGSNTVLIAPVTVGRGARTGAGAVVPSNKDVPPGATSVGVPARPLRSPKGQAGDKPGER